MGTRAKKFAQRVEQEGDDEINFGSDEESDDDFKTRMEGVKRMDDDYEYLQSIPEPGIQILSLLPLFAFFSSLCRFTYFLAKKKKRTLYEDDVDEDGKPVKKDRKMEQYLDILYDSMLKRRERQKKFMVNVSKRASHLNPAQSLEIVPESSMRNDDDEEEDDDDEEDGPKNKLILNKNVCCKVFLSF